MGKVKIDLNNKTILVTGSPGFIGANLVIRLLKELSGGTVVSLDNMNDYYDVKLKEYRLGLIEKAAHTSPVSTTRMCILRATSSVSIIFSKPAGITNLFIWSTHPVLPSTAATRRCRSARTIR